MIDELQRACVINYALFIRERPTNSAAVRSVRSRIAAMAAEEERENAGRGNRGTQANLQKAATRQRIAESKVKKRVTLVVAHLGWVSYNVPE